MNARIVKAAAGLALFVLGALFPAMADAQTDIYILAGQSNMVGVPPGQTPTQNPTQLFMFNANGQFEQAKDPLDSLAPGQNPVGVGPGLAFADKMATYFPGTQMD